MTRPAPTPVHAARPLRVALDGALPAAHAGLLVRDDPHPFALVGRWAGGGAIAGSCPVRTARREEDPFALLDEQPEVEGATLGPALADGAAATAGDPPPAPFFGGGWVGRLGYRLGARLEPHLPAPPARERLPAFDLAFYDHVVRFAGGSWWFEALWTPERAAALDERLAELRARLAAAPAPRPCSLRPFRAEPSPTGHARAVQACRERIAAGDLFQANLALRLRSSLDGDPADLFARGAAELAPDRAAWVGGAVSLSPELYLERHGRTARSAPIKGTAPRTQAAEALAASSKDRAENVMIVDLVRNDLGRVCAYGTVTVDALAEPRPHAGVWHLVSEVRGTLRDEVGDGELVAATFPPGSVTGAPKLAAVDVISELESAERQTFTGAIGFASPCAGLELSVAIRTFEHDGAGNVWLDVGGGVTFGSDPGAEAAEALAKAAPLLAAVGAPPLATPTPGPSKTHSPSHTTEKCVFDGRDGGSGAAPVRFGPRPVPRPDPALGVFETVLVRDGEPVDLDLHLARLAASLDELYGTKPALPELPPLPDAARLRLLADTGGAVQAELAPLPPPAQEPLRATPVVVPGGLGAHKWRDRRLLDALTQHAAPAVPVLVDLDGFLLEGAWAAAVAVLPGGLVAPPLDGRILPSVGRRRLRDLRVRPVHVDEVRDLLLVSALRTVRATLGS